MAIGDTVHVGVITELYVCLQAADLRRSCRVVVVGFSLMLAHHRRL